MGTGRNLQVARIYALCLQRIHFFQQRLRIDNHTGTYNADSIRIHNSTGHKAQRVSLTSGNHRVSCVVSALGTYDYIGFCREIIYNLSLTFIAPLSANDHSCCHYILPSII